MLGKFCDIMWCYLGQMSLYFTWVDLSVYWLPSICLCLRLTSVERNLEAFEEDLDLFELDLEIFFLVFLLFHIYNYWLATIFARSQMLVDSTSIFPTSMFVSASQGEWENMLHNFTCYWCFLLLVETSLSLYSWIWNSGEHTIEHWGQEKMTAILQTTVSNAFSWMKMFEFSLKFHWNLFPGVQLTIFQHWFKDNGLAPNRWQAIIWTSDAYMHHLASVS